IKYDRNAAKSAVIGYIHGAEKGDVIALRADMDALPVCEATGLDFASKNSFMHACGHDAHTSILLGAAKVLNDLKGSFKGTVKLIFQPAEELGTGSVDICEKGILDDVKEIIGLHVGCISDEAKPGEFLFSKGSMMACMDKFSIKVKGVGAHGAYPSLSVDPVVIGSHIVVAIQEILGREVHPTEPAVITVGQFHSGSAFNIIPPEAYLEGTVRAVTNETRELIAKRIEEVASNIAKAFRGSIEYQFFRQPPPLINDAKVTDKAMGAAKELFPNDVKLMQRPVMGGEDFAWYLEKVPGSFIFLSTPSPIEGKVWPHHNPKFALDESQFYKGTALFVAYVMQELGK
ncbi:amidohydrolase, partial [Treponema denticola]